MSVILFGFKGCGKTTFGKKLAEHLEVPFVDTDEALEDAYFHDRGSRLSCAQIYAQEGNEVFRAFEEKAILALDKNILQIISVGAGAVFNPKNVAHLWSVGTLVQLLLDQEILKQRLLSKPLPPVFEKEPFEVHWRRRVPLYAIISPYAVNATALSDEQVVDALRPYFQKEHNGK